MADQASPGISPMGNLGHQATRPMVEWPAPSTRTIKTGPMGPFSFKHAFDLKSPHPRVTPVFRGDILRESGSVLSGPGKAYAAFRFTELLARLDNFSSVASSSLRVSRNRFIASL
jgi:hypothetical protein